MRLVPFIVKVGVTTLIIVLSVLPNSSIAERGYNDPVDQDAAIYPNPARDFIFFRADKVVDFETSSGNISITVMDILGNPLLVQPEKVQAHTYRIDVSEFTAGYYMLVAQPENSPETKRKVFRFLKQ
ncbi:MAG: T9SS type A sorting domain-containing protein [Bacteroidota bacterium]